MTPRCHYSDLPPTACAHCQGHDTDVPASTDARTFDDLPRGRVVWPLPSTRAPSRYPAPIEEPTDDPRVQVARDLRAILSMAATLGDRAEDLATDPAIPGGEAMVNLAHSGNLEAWENRQSTSDRLGLAYTSVADEDPDHAWSAAQTLEFWSEDWRRALGKESDHRATLRTEANFLGDPDVLAWAWDHEPRVDDFVSDVHAARAKLENLVRDGIRETRSRIMCDRCKEPKRLIRKWAKGDRPDVWKAPCCKVELTDNEAKRAHAKQMRSAGAERWVEIGEAAAALRVQGWQERTIRRWLEPIHHSRDRCTECGSTWPAREFPACKEPRRDGECGGLLVPIWAGSREAVVVAWCDPVKHQTFVWWPDLWQRHLLAAHRREARMLPDSEAV